jgi:hypothetical protein
VSQNAVCWHVPVSTVPMLYCIKRPIMKAVATTANVCASQCLLTSQTPHCSDPGDVLDTRAAADSCRIL